MTLIDKAEALAPCPFCGGSLVWSDTYREYHHPRAKCILSGHKFKKGVIGQWNRRAALPARGVGVTWHPFDTAPRDGSRFLAQGGGLDAIDICSYNARVGCWDCGSVTLDDTDHEPEGYNRPAQWMPLAALFPAPAPTDAAHVNEKPKSEHDAGNVLTAAQARAPFFFDRYINGVRMAEDVCIERETTLEGAMQAAARIAAKGPNGEAPVLVYRAPAAQAREAALREAAAVAEAILKQDAKAAEPHDTAIASDRWEYAEQIPAAILALIGGSK